MKRNNLTRYILLYLASALFLLVFIGPFVWLVSSSLQLERQLVKVPPVWLPDPVSLASYKEIFMVAFSMKQRFPRTVLVLPTSHGYISALS